jgi:hypothetical protein
VLGRVPLTGRVLITEPIEDSTAAGRQDERHQHRVTSAGPRAGRAGFLDAVTYPEISFRSELLAWVPAGWRTVGCLNLRGTEHELACLRPGPREAGRLGPV